MVVIKEVNKRGVLSEGRNTGMGFAFLKKEGDEYHTAHALSPCKDYLNDVVFTENTGYPLSVYGLSYKKKDIFDGMAYMTVKMVKSHNSGSYRYSKDIEVDKAYLKNNYKNIQNLINHFEAQLEMKTQTIIEEANDDYFFMIVPLEWCVSSYAISLFSLLVRVAMVYEGGDVMEFLKGYNYNGEDVGLLKPSLPKLEKILETKKLPLQGDYNEEHVKNKQWTPHNYGIVSLQIEKI